jgi:parallel beta-helix repeat protein
VVSDSTSDGIALYATTGVVVKGNVVIGSGGNGLYADATSTGNTFRANRASGSVLFDCRDDSNDGGTSVPIPANTWENNQGTTALPPWICAP